MKFYSEKLDKLFDNKQDLFNAEREHAKKIADEKAAFEARESQLKAQAEEEAKTISKRKKELSDEIESASKMLDEAYKFYEAERAKAKDILADAQKKANEILSNARKEANDLVSLAETNVKSASEKKTKAISNFNKEFGPYRTIITGDKAIEEYNKMIRDMDNTFSKIFNNFFTWKF